MMSGYLSVPFFPSIKGEELEFLFYIGDVELLFIRKIETGDNINRKITQDHPQISFPHYKGFSGVDRAEQWFDLINLNEPLEKPYIPKLSDLWTIIFTSGTTFNP